MRRSALLFPLAVLFMALSGFDCATTSSQMSTAKVAMGRKDYVEAAKALEKEVELRPNNGTAWLMLAEIYDEQMRPVASMNALAKARAATEPKLTAQQLDDTYIRQFNLWRTTYNRALSEYRNKQYQRALQVLDTAMIVGPEYTENVYFRGNIYEDMSDVASANRAYEQYLTMIEPMVAKGQGLGLSLDMTPASVEAKLGAPTKKMLVDSLGGWYYYQPQDIYVYFAPASKDRGPHVEGWRSYDAVYPERLRGNPTILRADPYAILGMAARDAKEHDRALRYLQTLSRLDPDRPGVAATITQIYVDNGRINEAIASLQSEIAANPNDPRAFIDLGNLYVGAKRYNEAIAAFQKVQSLNLPANDQTLHTALFNLGAVNKNWGASLQDSIRKVSKDKPTKAQTEVYLKPLRESVKYFEMLRTAKPTDYPVLVELGNLYDVLGDVANRDKMIRELEGLATANSGDKTYWRAMERRYAILGDVAKAEAAGKKARSNP